MHIKKNTRLALFYLGLVTCAFNAAAAETSLSNKRQPSDKLKLPKDAGLTVSLPVNHLQIHGPDSHQVKLILKVPKDFKPLQPLDGSSHLLEFIPRGDDQFNWSEILTANIIVGKALQADTLLKIMVEDLKVNAGAIEILKMRVEKYDHYTMAEAALIYQQKGREDVVYFRAYSGPFDLVCTQYAVALRPSETPQKALKRAQKALDEYTVLADVKEVNGEWIENK
ncbi:hypothetical protein [Candidatus Odyssella acanthamoebae]|uniref:Uncharacterized protein n=1 Tax=Candidatus Odyssella acanthamoebae TaxID=91604 RepID=A0A077AYD4_9PROT|nr:hypothetical protein [Candidatus Paracaedibacter acanthamoebae]AIK95745.1 hypothetical protein ID47_01830 [Candidatus Paracaedibacter acanthamoebae]